MLKVVLTIVVPLLLPTGRPAPYAAGYASTV